jgi:hypothetical protein
MGESGRKRREDWEVVWAGGVGTRGMGKRGRAEDKGKGDGDDLIGI